MPTTKVKQVTLDPFLNFGNQKKQEAGKFVEIGQFVQLAQELDKTLDEYVHFTSSSQEFKSVLKDKFDGDIRQVNQNLVILALTEVHIEKVAEDHKELKKLLPSLQEKRKVLNENVEKVAKELGYGVAYYPLDKVMNKDLNGVKETLKQDFGAEPKFEKVFSANALNSLTDLFAFIVGKVYIIDEANIVEIPAKKELSTKRRRKRQQIGTLILICDNNTTQNFVAQQTPEEERQATLKAVERKDQDIKGNNLSSLKAVLASRDQNARREALPVLEKALKNPDQVIRKEALFYLEVALVNSDKPEDILDFYKVSLESPYKDVRMKATQILKKILTNGRQ